MADTMQFDLVSPERKLKSGDVREVQLPGAEGDMTALPDHAPLITTLRPGVVRIISETGTDEYVVTGGFAEINSGAMSVLAEQALPVSELSQDMLNDMVAQARSAHDSAKDGGDGEILDSAAKRLADLQELGSQLGLTAQ